MGMFLPLYSYNPGDQFNVKTYQDVYVEFIFGQQDLLSRDRLGERLLSAKCKAMVYENKDQFEAFIAPIETLEIDFTGAEYQDDLQRMTYGAYLPWDVPVAVDPYTEAADLAAWQAAQVEGQPETPKPVTAPEPLRIGGFKYQTAYILRSHPIFAQPGATWD